MRIITPQDFNAINIFAFIQKNPRLGDFIEFEPVYTVYLIFVSLTFVL